MTRRAAPAVLAAFVLAAAWRPLILGGQIPVDGNMLTLSYPHWSMARSLWREPGLPLWNPARNLGEPYLADPQTMAAYPPFWAASALPDFADFLRVWIVLHSLLSATFMALLALRWHRDPAAAAAAAAVGALNGFFTARVAFPNHFAAAAWLPAILYFQDSRSPLALGACLALQWLAGFPPFFGVSAAAALALASTQGREGLFCFFKALAIALGLSAVEWLPFGELLERSTRTMVLSAASAAQYSLPPGQLLKELLLPQWYAVSPSLHGDPAIVAFYAGPAALGLAAWGVRHGSPREKALALLAAAALLLSLGEALPGYSVAPLLRIFRFPANWLLAASAAIGLLCAAGVARLAARWRWAAAAAVTLDLILFAQFPRTAWSRPAFLTEAPALARELRSLPQPARIYHTDRLRSLWQRGTLNEEEDYLLMRDYLAPSFGTAFGVQEVSSYQTLRLKTADAYLKRLNAAGPASSLMDATGAAILATTTRDAGGLTRKTLRLLRRNKVLPRVFIAGGRPGETELLSYRPGRVRAKVRSPGPCAAVFSEMDYPGWQVRLDGREVSHYSYEDAFIAVAVPTGEHELAFDFSPASFRLGLWLSVATLLGVIFAGRKRTAMTRYSS